jgi:hypothetical protein
MLVMVLAVPLGTGCAPSRYRFISLEEVPAISVDRHGTADLAGLYFSSTMPIEYSLYRERYSLRFRVPSDVYLPALQIAVEGKKGEVLSLSQQGWRRARRDPRAPCGSFQTLPRSKSELRFSWTSCGKEAPDKQFISFDVLAESGQVVGNEDIPFKLKINGIYVVPDVL